VGSRRGARGEAEHEVASIGRQQEQIMRRSGARSYIHRRPEGIIIENGRPAGVGVRTDAVSGNPGASLFVKKMYFTLKQHLKHVHNLLCHPNLFSTSCVGLLFTSPLPCHFLLLEQVWCSGILVHLAAIVVGELDWRV